jgi:hypothetical protein
MIKRRDKPTVIGDVERLTENNKPLVRIKSISSHMREQEPHPFARLEIKFNGSLVLHHVNSFKPDRDQPSFPAFLYHDSVLHPVAHMLRISLSS